MSRTLQGLVVVQLALAIIFSCTFVGNKMTDPVTYTHTIEVLDRNCTTVLGLSAASAAASAAVSTLPDDMCSSIADQLSEFTSWFMMILGFIYIEKYLLTILGAVACYGLFPLGFGALLVDRFFPKSSLRSVGVKFVILGTAVLLTIPSSFGFLTRFMLCIPNPSKLRLTLPMRSVIISLVKPQRKPKKNPRISTRQKNCSAM